MAERHPVSNDLFWVAILWIGALFAGAIFAVVIGRIAGAGVGAGLFFGAIIFVLTGWFVATFAAGSRLPPPNTLTAPTVPRSADQASSDGSGSIALNEAADDVGGKISEASQHAGAAVRALGSAVSQAAAEVGRAASEVGGVVARKAGELGERVSEAAEPPGVASVEPEAQPSPRLAEVPAEAPVETGLDAAAAASRPATLTSPRDGGPDDLKRIKGVGPKFEVQLHELGIFHFDQIAGWGPAELAWIDANLEGFSGRAAREDWVGQSTILAAGGDTEHSLKVDRGEST